MWVSVLCQCGKQIRAPSAKIGDTVRCPRCQSSVLIAIPGAPLKEIPDAPPEGETPDSVREVRGSNPLLHISVLCACSQRFRVSAVLAGQLVACPHCRRPNVVQEQAQRPPSSGELVSIPPRLARRGSLPTGIIIGLVLVSIGMLTAVIYLAVRPSAPANKSVDADPETPIETEQADQKPDSTSKKKTASQLEPANKPNTKSQIKPKENQQADQENNRATVWFDSRWDSQRRERTLAQHRWNQNSKLQFIGPGNDRNLLDKFMADSAFSIEQDGTLSPGSVAALELGQFPKDFTLILDMDASGLGGWWILWGWNGKEGSLLYNITLKQSVNWYVLEAEEGKFTRWKEIERWRWDSRRPFSMTVREQTLQIKVGDQELTSKGFRLSSSRGGILALGTAPTQYGPKPLRIYQIETTVRSPEPPGK